jgi:AraC-like DNA-binding protein
MLITYIYITDCNPRTLNLLDKQKKFHSTSLVKHYPALGLSHQKYRRVYEARYLNGRSRRRWSVAVPQSIPLGNHRLVRTNSLDRMREALGRVYAQIRYEPLHRSSTFDIELNNYQLPHAGISYVRYGATIRLAFPETNLFTQKFPLRGSGEVSVAGKPIILTPESSEVSSPGTTYASTFDADYEHLILRLDPRALTQKLVALTGSPLRAPLQVKPAQTLASAKTRALRSMFMLVVREIGTAKPQLPAALLAQMQQTLMVSFLYANSHNYSELLEKRPTDVAPWQVFRAEEYIRENWNKPILIEDIAEATNASVRSIFRTFKRTRGYSPLAFAKQIRMQQAHRLLKQADAATTVTDIAMDCGYSNLSAFTKDYRRAFGELPSQVLNWSRKGLP